MLAWVIDWQAWATLAAGAAAVTGAYFLWRRQEAILLAQTAIQNRQAGMQAALVRTEEMKLREALFDRRFEVYDAAVNWFGYIQTTGAIPGRMTRAQRVLSMQNQVEFNIPGSKERLAFAEAMHISEFLFRSEVHETLAEAWRVAERHADANASEPIDYEEGETRQTVKAAAWAQLLELQPKIASVMGPELTIAE